MHVELVSPCGFSLIETTCLGGLPSCTVSPEFSTCSVVPATSKCAIRVMLGDGTTHDVAVTDDKCVAPGFVSFLSATCVAPAADAGFGDASSE